VIFVPGLLSDEQVTQVATLTEAFDPQRLTLVGIPGLPVAGTAGRTRRGPPPRPSSFSKQNRKAPLPSVTPTGSRSSEIVSSSQTCTSKLRDGNQSSPML
jgi:hypothetical protein